MLMRKIAMLGAAVICAQDAAGIAVADQCRHLLSCVLNSLCFQLVV